MSMRDGESFEKWQKIRSEIGDTIDRMKGVIGDFNNSIHQITAESAPNIEEEFTWFIENGFVPGAVFLVPRLQCYIYVKTYTCGVYNSGAEVVLIGGSPCDCKEKRASMSIKRIKSEIKKGAILKADGTPIELKED